jgi:hypothetical protein
MKYLEEENEKSMNIYNIIIIFNISQTPNRNQNYNILKNPNQDLIRTKIRILMHIFLFHFDY